MHQNSQQLMTILHDELEEVKLGKPKRSSRLEIIRILITCHAWLFPVGCKITELAPYVSVRKGSIAQRFKWAVGEWRNV